MTGNEHNYQIFTDEILEEIKEFAEDNLGKDDKEQFYVDDPEFALADPWYDCSGRFPLTDEQAIHEWGLPNVINFCIGALDIIRKKKEESKKQ